MPTIPVGIALGRVGGRGVKGVVPQTGSERAITEFRWLDTSRCSTYGIKIIAMRAGRFTLSLHEQSYWRH